MLSLGDFSSLSGTPLSTPINGKFGSIGIDNISEIEKTKLLHELSFICDPKNLDLAHCILVKAELGLFVSAVLPPKVYCQDGKLALKLGTNFVELVFNEAENCWFTPAKKPLILTVQQDPTSKVNYPVFQLTVTGKPSRILQFTFKWKQLKDLQPVKDDLLGLLLPPSEDLHKYVDSFAAIPAPMYSLVLGADIPPTGVHYQVIGVEKTLGDYGESYVLSINPDHLPKTQMWKSDGSPVPTGAVRAVNTSHNALIAPGEYERIKKGLQSKTLEAWLVITGLTALGDNIIVNHAFVVMPKDQFKKFVPNPVQAVPAVDPPKVVAGQPNPVIAALKAAASKGM